MTQGPEVTTDERAREAFYNWWMLQKYSPSGFDLAWLAWQAARVSGWNAAIEASARECDDEAAWWKERHDLARAIGANCAARIRRLTVGEA